jgi:hypothetical protein
MVPSGLHNCYRACAMGFGALDGEVVKKLALIDKGHLLRNACTVTSNATHHRGREPASGIG